jgi:MFS family permease
VTTAQERVRYRTVLANREFAAVFAAQNLSLLGDQLARIALAILVYDRTGSALQASATYGVSYIAYLVGGPLLSGLADRYPRLTVMVVCDVVRVPLVLALCIDSLPLWSLFLIIAALGAAGPPFDSARSALQPELLSGDSYVVGNTLLNVCMQVSQVLGFVLGGTVVAFTSVRGALVLDAATFLLSAGLLLASLRQRPAAQTDAGAFFSDTVAGVRLVARTDRLRTLLALAVLASVAVTSAEGLAVAIADELHHGAVAAGILTASIPAGFLVGSVLVLRTAPERREDLLPVLVLVSAAPLLLTPLLPSVLAIVLVWVLAGAGATANLIAGPAFVQSCPPDVRGRAYGVASATLMSTQGLGLVVAGWVGTQVEPRTAVALVAAAMLLLSLPAIRAQGTARIVRKESVGDVQGEGRQ